MDKAESEGMVGVVGYRKNADGSLPPHNVKDGEFALKMDDIFRKEKVVLVVFADRGHGLFFAKGSECAGHSVILGLEADERVTPLGSYDEITKQTHAKAAEAIRRAALDMGLAPLHPLVVVRAIWMATTRGIFEGVGMQGIVRDAIKEDDVIYEEWIRESNQAFAKEGVDFRTGRE